MIFKNFQGFQCSEYTLSEWRQLTSSWNKDAATLSIGQYTGEPK